MRKAKIAVGLAVFFLVLGIAAWAWWPRKSGWLCCVKNTSTGATTCVEMDSVTGCKCTGCYKGYCSDYTVDPSGAATCHDKPQ